MRTRPLAGLAAAVLLAACGSDEPSGSANTEPAPSAATAEPAATEPPATASPATDAPATEPPATDPPTTDGPTTEPPATDPPTTDATDAAADTEPAAFETIGSGPYDVGVSTITITDTGRDRTLTVDVWFPLADGTAGAPHRYTLLPGVYYESPFAITADVSAVATDGPFPLVVYSHGSGGLRYLHSNYTETIASYGYLVVAPDHRGNTTLDRFTGAEADFEVTALARPNDITAVIDAMLDPQNEATAGFVTAIDPERIAVTGHSFGGFTAYAMVSGYDNNLGDYAPDGRVDAIIPLAPATGDGTRLLTDEMLGRVDVPALVIVGTDDKTTPVDPNVTRAWELTASDPHVRVELVAGEHQTFTDLCNYADFLPTLESVPDVVVETIETFGEEGCSPGDMPLDRAHALTNTFAVQFLDSVFRDGAPIDAETTFPDDVIVLIK